MSRQTVPDLAYQSIFALRDGVDASVHVYPPGEAAGEAGAAADGQLILWPSGTSVTVSGIPLAGIARLHGALGIARAAMGDENVTVTLTRDEFAAVSDAVHGTLRLWRDVWPDRPLGDLESAAARLAACLPARENEES
ncbi:MAG TPA: hypothetical protein VN213_18280 [Solirubrobacteraceae bacterium]|nr:hypothetical protein [Solirubrobacteraceae bacterium]